MWHAGRSISGELAYFFSIGTAPCCAMLLFYPSLFCAWGGGRGLGAHQECLRWHRESKSVLLSLHITGHQSVKFVALILFSVPSFLNLQGRKDGSILSEVSVMPGCGFSIIQCLSYYFLTKCLKIKEWRGSMHMVVLQ